MSRCTEWPDLLSAAQPWWCQLSILISSEVALGSFASQHLFGTFPLSKITDSPLVALVVVSREGFRAGGLTTHTVKGAIGGDAHDAAKSCIICTNTIKKVWVPAIPVTVLAYHLLKSLVLIELVFPLVVVVV